MTVKAHLVDGTYELFRHHFGLPEEARSKPGTNGAARGVLWTVYYLLEDQLAKISPEFWQFGVGLVLVLVVLFGRGGLLGLLDAIAPRWRRAGRPAR